MRAAAAALGLALLLAGGANGDFMYPDFNNTLGLKLNGAASTTNCVDVHYNAYGPTQAAADTFAAELDDQFLEDMESQEFQTVETAVRDDVFDDINADSAIFGHRDSYVAAPDERCGVRVRMTPSQPHQIGSFWYTAPLPVFQGFLTLFSFQVSDHSKVCTQHRDPIFSTLHHSSCKVHGGDGFAFVVHGDPTGEDAIGAPGAGVGYAGLENFIAVEFDTWYNTEDGNADLLPDHISIHGAALGGTSVPLDNLLGAPRIHDVGDGQVHLVQVAYLPYLAHEYAGAFSTSAAAYPFMKDNGENRRMGTFVVWVDGGIAADAPLIAIPINLSVLLHLDLDLAYVGFTAATGKAWEKHDLLSWYWCDSDECDETTMDSYDYHQTSVSHVGHRRQWFTPGDGFGGGGAPRPPVGADPNPDPEPQKHRSPDTAPWKTPQVHRSGFRHAGLFSGADDMIPPETEI